jgi:hypothetical protein
MQCRRCCPSPCRWARRQFADELPESSESASQQVGKSAKSRCVEPVRQWWTSLIASWLCDSTGSGAKRQRGADLSPCCSGFPPFGLNTAARRMGHPIFVVLPTLPGTEASAKWTSPMASWRCESTGCARTDSGAADISPCWSGFPPFGAEHRSPKNGAPDFCGATYIAKYRGECKGGLRRPGVAV